jgi:hypothetical protein
MRRFILSALVALTVFAVTLGNPTGVQAQSPAPIPVFMPTLADYAPLPPPVVPITVCLPAPACDPAPNCLQAAPVCNAPVFVHRHHGHERSHEVRHFHGRHCR